MRFGRTRKLGQKPRKGLSYEPRVPDPPIRRRSIGESEMSLVERLSPSIVETEDFALEDVEQLEEKRQARLERRSSILKRSNSSEAILDKNAIDIAIHAVMATAAFKLGQKKTLVEGEPTSDGGDASPPSPLSPYPVSRNNSVDSSDPGAATPSTAGGLGAGLLRRQGSRTGTPITADTAKKSGKKKGKKKVAAVPKIIIALGEATKIGDVFSMAALEATEGWREEAMLSCWASIKKDAYDVALGELEHILAAGDDNPAFHNLKADLYCRKGNLDLTRENMKSKDPAAIVGASAFHHLYRHDLETAIRWGIIAKEIQAEIAAEEFEDEDTVATINLSKLMLFTGLPTEGLTYADEAYISGDPSPENVETCLLQAQMNHELGNLPDAMRCCQEALSYDSESVHAHLIISYIHTLSKDPNNALASLGRAIELSDAQEDLPYDFEVYDFLFDAWDWRPIDPAIQVPLYHLHCKVGLLLEEIGEEESALEHFEESLIRHKSSHDILDILANRYFDRGLAAQAVSFFLEFSTVATASARTRALLLAALALNFLGDTRTAIATATTALKADSQNYECWYYRAFLNSKVDPKAAMKDLQRLNNIPGAVHELGCMPRILSAQVEEQLKKPDLERAVKAYKAALVTDPDEIVIHLKLAQVQQQIGKKEDSLKSYNTYLLHCPLDAAAYIHRGLLKETMENGMIGAVRDYSRAFVANPSDFTPLLLRALALMAVGDSDNAIYDFYLYFKNHPPTVRSLLAFSQLNTILRKPIAAYEAALAAREIENNNITCAEVVTTGLLANEDPLEVEQNLNEITHFDGRHYFLRGITRRYKGDITAAVEDFRSSLTMFSKKYEILRSLTAKSFCLMELGFIDDAIADFTKVTMKDKSFAAAYLGRGMCYERKNKLRFASMDYDRAVKNEPNGAYVYVVRAMLRARMEENMHALADCTSAISKDRTCVIAYLLRGTIYQKVGMSKRAVVDINRFLDRWEEVKSTLGFEGTYDFAVRNRGIAKACLGQYDEALEDLRTVLDAFGEDPFLHLAMSACYMEQGNLEKCLTSTYTVTALCPTIPEAYVMRASCFLQDRTDTTTWRKARRELSTAMHLNPTLGWAHALMSSVLRSQGSLKLAWKKANDAVRVDDENGDMYKFRANMSMMIGGNRQGAMFDLNKALNHCVRHQSEVLCLRGLLRERMGDNTAAMADYEEAIHLDPNNDTAHFNLGNVFLDYGRYTKALYHYERCDRRGGIPEYVTNNKGIVNCFLKKYDEAGENFSEALEMTDNNGMKAPFYMNRAVVKSATDRMEEATDDFELAIAQNPRDPVLYVNRGHAHAADGKTNRAMVNYATALSIDENINLSRT